MGKKGGKEKGKKKDKASAKPETMSDAEWALYNNVAELVMVRMATLSGVAFILFGWWFMSLNIKKVIVRSLMLS